MPIPDELLVGVPNSTLRYLSLSIFGVSNYRYFPTSMMDKCGPEQWERLWILQACERLEIPTKLWPKFKFPSLPQMKVLDLRFRLPDQPELPFFSPLHESVAEWKTRCHKTLDELLEKHAESLNAKFQELVKQGMYTKIPQTRTTTDLNLRYEWAAQRICYNTRYSELAKDGYSVDRIKQSVLQILKTANWKRGK
jgi:hypothetical protein